MGDADIDWNSPAFVEIQNNRANPTLLRQRCLPGLPGTRCHFLIPRWSLHFCPMRRSICARWADHVGYLMSPGMVLVPISFIFQMGHGVPPLAVRPGHFFSWKSGRLSHDNTLSFIYAYVRVRVSLHRAGDDAACACLAVGASTCTE